MKHLLTLISALVILSATVQADEVKKNRKSKAQKVATAPFIWGDPNEDAPLELQSRFDIKTQVPVAPFEWGIPEELSEIVESIKLKNATVPVAPFEMGDPDEEIPLILQNKL